MSELQYIPVSETPVFEGIVIERLLPTHTPEMGFQSYEKLDGDSDYRKTIEQQFRAGEIRNPKLDYPNLDIDALKLSTVPLEFMIEQARYLFDSIASEAIQTSAAYHEVEMVWLIIAKKMNDLAQADPTSDEFKVVAKQYQEVNEVLYSKPNEKVARQVFGEILAQAGSKKLDESGKQILSELTNGTFMVADGKIVWIPGIGDKTNGERLPVIDQDALKDLTEVLSEDTIYIKDIIQTYWRDVIEPRDGTKGKFTTQDMKEVFTQGRNHLDPDDKAGISVDVLPNKSVLSWDTPTMTVQIGENRASIGSTSVMQAKETHELYVHGVRTVKGLMSRLALLGTGMYTSPKAGERADYLTFEEGLATVAEAAVKTGSMEWKAPYISLYLAATTTYMGMDFRQSYEINWRARVLMALKDGDPITTNLIESEQKQAYLSVVRIKRGTPTELVNGPVLTFNKDLAYLEGKLAVLDYLKSIKGDKAKIRRLFTAKFDPTNSTQDELVTRYGVS